MLNRPDGRGVWSIVLPLPPGRYEYQFIINHETWVLDPAAPAVDDGMGGQNSLLIVGD
jgi:1,4-alpha-glucan branching enzyme